MNKLVTTLIFISIFSLTIIAQEQASLSIHQDISWEEMMLRPEYSFKDIQKAFYKVWKNKTYVKDDGYKLFKRWEYMMEPIIDSKGFFDKNKVETEAIRYMEKKASNHYRAVGGNWSQLGPFGFISEYGIGRVNVVSFNPNNDNILWLGAASGGLWKSTNGGDSWVSFSNDFRMMGISDIIIDQNNTDLMYIATGDRDAGDTDSYGILKSIDGGNTWDKTNFPNASRITRILINPSNSLELFASTNAGIYKTIDGGDSWNYILTGLFIREMEFKPGNFNVIYATDYSYSDANSHLYRTIDGGDNFTTISIDNLPSTVGRIAIGVTADNPEVVYLSAAINQSGWDGQDLEGIYKSEDSGTTFSKIEMSTPPELGSQSWYDWTFVVSPDNENELFAGGVRFYKSTDGGINWAQSSNWSNPNNNDHFHVDHHFAGFQPSTNILFVGNDGGVYKSETKGKYWTALNDDLSITQYYKMGAAADNRNLIIGGSQDNGTHLLKNNNWSRIMGGDGMDCFIDYSNSNNMFASYQNGHLRRSIDKGNSFKKMLTTVETSETGAWVTPMIMDPIEPNIIYAGFESIWKSEDKGIEWTKTSDKLAAESTVRGIRVASSNNNYIYAYYPTNIFKSEDKGLTWLEVSVPTGSFIQDLAISPTNPDKIWLAISNRVYSSLDGGSTWSNITSTLPNVPKTALAIQNNSIESLYLGTYIGIFYIDNTMSDWIPFDEGLPPVRIGDLKITPQFGTIRAASYGRGVWESDLYDFNENLPLCTNITYPENGDRIIENNLTVTWNNVGNADGYKLNIGTELGANDIIQDLDITNGSSYEWQNIEVEGKVFVTITPYNIEGEAENCVHTSFYVGCVFEDKTALIEFYNSTKGYNWKNNWDTTECDIRKWYGVTTDIEGKVISLDLDGFNDNKHSSNGPGNQLSGIIDSTLAKLTHLKNLYIANNELSGNLPESISSLVNLEELDLSHNNFSGSFPDGISGIKSLTYLDLSYNSFSGEINTSFSNWKNIVEFKLNNNNFSGKIPSSIGSLQNSWNIDLSNNEFSGTLPFQLWFLKSLFVLNLSNNKLSGKLSKQVSGISSLTYFFINNNEISGKIPETLGKLDIEVLDMSSNKLEGCFPDELSKFCGKTINFSNNILLPNNGNFSLFCSQDKGNCSKVPSCSAGFSMLTGGDSLLYTEPISWFAADSATGYKISIGTTSNGTDIANNINVSIDTIFSFGNWPIGNRIYVNILPYNEFGHSYECDELSFIAIKPTSIIENDTINFGAFVKVFPVPANDFITIKKQTNDLGDLDLEILNISGSSVYKELINKKEHQVNIKSFSKGIYFIKMKIKEQSFIKKLIVQ